MFDSKTWECPLCLYRNKYDKSYLQNRYATSIERSQREECNYNNISMEIPISQSTFYIYDCFISSRDVQYSENAREVLAFIVDCTADDEFFEYSKEIITTIVEHYHEQADFRIGI